jgi:hypothetical protein
MTYRTKRGTSIIMAIVIFALLLSNPGVASYSAWMRDTAAEEVGAQADPLIMTLAAPMIEAATTEYNCGLFTVFRTGERVTVGVLGRFVMVR